MGFGDLNCTGCSSPAQNVRTQQPYFTIFGSDCQCCRSLISGSTYINFMKVCAYMPLSGQSLQRAQKL
eukprot:3006021-Amphidinium_carterae.1